MASRMKEDEKNEKIIRGLLKLSANRRCINCNSLGPQYVCTNFWTFVCTTCSGIHREFTHRVKSVSMAKFTSQEVSSLQGGGNERARVIYFKEWDSQRQSAPDSSNVDRLRDFIKHVYVDRRYTGERVVDKPPRVKMGEKDDSYENRRVDTYRGGSRSPSYEDRYDRNYSDRSSLGGRTDDRNYRYNYDERRSPGYDQETRYGDYRKSPGRFEVVDDRRRDDRFGNGRRSEESRFSDGESRFDGRSPNRQKDLDTSSPPMVRPVRDILGEDAPPLRISGPPKPNDGKVADGSAKTQRTASSSSLGSVDTSSVDLKGGNSGSLIDFDADPEPPATTAAPPARPTTSVVQPIPQPTASASSDSGNWASFDFVPQAPVQTQTQAPVQTQTQAPSSNPLESLLSQLSAPATASVVFPTAGGGAPTVAPVSNIAMSPISAGVQAVVSNASLHINGGFTASPAGNVSTLRSSGGASIAVPGGVMSLAISGGDHGGLWANTQQNQPSLLPANSGSIASQFIPSVGGAPNNQPWNSSFMQNVHGPLNATAQQSQAASGPTQETFGVSASQPALSETKTTGRKELPADLFAATYSTVRMPVPHWHTGISPGMGYGMQYPTAAPMQVQPMQSFPRPSKPTNPFDLNSESTMVYAQSFPSMASLQGALPNVAAPSGLVHSSSFGTVPLQWMPTQSPSYASAMPASAYMGQQLPTNVQALGHQGSGGFGSEAASFGTINSDPQMGGRYLIPATPNSFSSVGGNPFG